MIDFSKGKSLLVIGICLLFSYFAIPNFLTASQREEFAGVLSPYQLNLGLDLQGGAHLLLEIDTDHYLREQVQNLADEVRTKLREKHFSYKSLAAQGKNVSFSSDVAEGDLIAAIHEISTTLQLNSLPDAAGNFQVTYSDADIREMQQKLMEQSIQIVNRRVNESGTREPIIQRQGENRILLQVPGLENPKKLKELLGKTAKMTFHLVDENVTPDDIAAGVTPPIGTRMLPSDSPQEKDSMGNPFRYAVKNRVMLSGDLLSGASATYDQGQPVVSFKFNVIGAKKFAQITQDNVGRPFAIVLDNKVITAPRINEPILGGSGIISGSFSVEGANDLALLLRAGALPAPLKVVEERSVGPSLGADSIAAGKRASLIGVVLVMVFMLISYGRFGLYADISLLVNLMMIMGALSLFRATLTLPGIAGIVLTMGMAVDANVLIYERIREEMRHGKGAFAAVRQGFEGALNTIMDSNLTTLIAALLLYYFGTGSIKGFAVTLCIGIISSVFTAVFFTKMQIAWWMNWKRPKVIPL
jgi:preprotein translocase subunit SecD